MWPKTAFAIAVALLIAGCIGGHPVGIGPPPPELGAAAPAAQGNANMRVEIAALRDRLAEHLNRVAEWNYDIARAGAWLEFAEQALKENSQAPIVEEVLAETAGAVRRLESNQAAPLRTPIVRYAQRLRRDLWELADQLKRDPQAACGDMPLARLEVTLVQAVYEQFERGPNGAAPMLVRAERLAREASAAIERCAREFPPRIPAPGDTLRLRLETMLKR